MLPLLLPLLLLPAAAAASAAAAAATAAGVTGRGGRRGRQVGAGLGDEVQLMHIVLSREERPPPQKLPCGGWGGQKHVMMGAKPCCAGGEGMPCWGQMHAVLRANQSVLGGGRYYCAGLCRSVAENRSGCCQRRAPKMQPTLHTSMAAVYSVQLSSSSGARYHLRHGATSSRRHGPRRRGSARPQAAAGRALGRPSESRRTLSRAKRFDCTLSGHSPTH